MCDDRPSPVTVIVAVLGEGELLASHVTIGAPSLFPDAGDTVTHASLLVTVQLTLDLIHIPTVPLEGRKLIWSVVTFRNFGSAMRKVLHTGAAL